MGSVIFEDYTERFKKIKKYRIELLTILNGYPDWEKNESIRKKVQILGNKLSCNTMDQSRPIKAIDSKKFSLQDYEILKNFGYTDKAISKAMGYSKQKFDRYKENHFKKKVIK